MLHSLPSCVYWDIKTHSYLYNLAGSYPGSICASTNVPEEKPARLNMETGVKRLHLCTGSLRFYSEMTLYSPFVSCGLLNGLYTSPLISIASNATYAFCLRIKLVRPHSGALSELEAQYSQQPGGARAEAERRR